MIVPIQVRLARTALGWTQQQLSDAASVSAITIKQIETGADVRVSALRSVEEALRAAGIVFIDADDHEGPGIRVRRQ